MQRFFIGEKRCVTTPITHLNLIPDDELDENWSHISFNSDQRQSTYYGILHQYFTLISSAGTTTCPELAKTPESDWLLLARENPNVATVNQERYTDFCRCVVGF